MGHKSYWYWLSDEDKFRGFLNVEPKAGPTQLWAGPFRTFSLAKAHALEYFRAKSKLAHRIAADIKCEHKP